MTPTDRCANVRRHLRLVGSEIQKILDAAPEPERGALRLVLFDVQGAARRIGSIGEHLRSRQ